MQETKLESEEEEEDDDEGPPPGFQCIINLQQPQKAEANDEENEDEEEDDGPPPGFDSIAPKPSPSLPSLDIAKSSKENDTDNDDEDEGPAPGWEFSALANVLPKPTSNTTDIRAESNEELDEGPPPGWEAVLPRQMPPPHTPLLSSSSVSSSIEIGSKPETMRNDDEAPQSVSQCKPISDHSPTPSSSRLSNDTRNKVNNKKVRIKRPTFGNNPKLISYPCAPPSSSSSEKAQLVCCTCRKLCSYSRGRKWVQCPGCHEVNFVLEAHEVGQVKCGKCAVLLMYPHGAPAVQCTSCLFVTEIRWHTIYDLRFRFSRLRGELVVPAEPVKFALVFFHIY
ncbi:hypothetical protein OROHE_010357 [Orobanche hederae]